MSALKVVALLALRAPSLLLATEVPERSEVPVAYKWDLTSMYASDEVWEQDFRQVENLIPEAAAFKGTLGKNAESLQIGLERLEEIEVILGNVYVYAGLRSYENMGDSESSARFSRARSLSSRYYEATSYVRPELVALPDGKLLKMIESTPELASRQHDMDRLLRLKPFTLSEREESLLASSSDAMGKFQSVFSAFDNADIRFGNITDETGETVELTDSLYGRLVYSTNRQVREDAWKGLHSEYEKLGNTLAANYEGHVKSRAFFAKARGYDSRLHAATYSSAIPREVFLNLIRTTREGAGPLQRYLALKRQHMGLEKLQVWDLYAPLVASSMNDIPWNEAKQIVADALKPLGKEYLDVYWKGFEEGWVDSLDSRGKRGGAYSWGTYTSKPYFSMKYEGTLNSVSTLAHEYGHSIHRYLSNDAQPYYYSGSRTFIAEVASMANEALLYQKLLAEASTRDEKIYLLQNYLDDFRGSFYRQVTFADFEMQAHATVESGDALTKDALNKIYADIFAAYYGDAVHTDPLNASEWSRIPHFLRTDNFYVYQYATAFAAATALAKQVRDGGEPARERFLDLLRAGNSNYPIELLKKAGIDMTSPQPILDTIAEFDSLVDQLEATINQPINQSMNE